MKNYWFKPARFWKWFAFYYPTSVEGWVATLILGILFIKLFVLVDMNSHSGSDALFAFAPLAVSIFLIFDLLCFRTGEYPSWWKRR